MQITTTDNIQQGKLYAGPTLPQGAKIIGTVTRDGTDTGALLEMPDGSQVQYNAGVIRRIPRRRGRPYLFEGGTRAETIRIPPDVWDNIPEPKRENAAKAVVEKYKEE